MRFPEEGEAIKMKNAMKKGSILALVFALLFSPLAMSALYAANGIETDRTDGSVAFDPGTEYPEVAGMEILVELYRVADVSPAGRYKEKEGWEGLGLSDVDAETTAQEWQEKASLAKKTAEENALEPDAAVTLNSPQNPENKAENLPVGMYLMVAHTVKSPQYEYMFLPALLSIPSHEYEPDNSQSGDDWIYQMEARLKPEQKERFGSLEIRKKLTSYNQTLGPAFFVFRIEAVKEGKKVYSDVVSLNFTEPGEKKLLVEKIPAGAKVTVTEIYSGASYTAVSGNEQTAEIIAEEMEGNPVSVSFENTHDKRQNGGSGIVNHFKYENETWEVEQQPDSSGEKQPTVSDREENPSEKNNGEKEPSDVKEPTAADVKEESGADTSEGAKIRRVSYTGEAVSLPENQANPAAADDVKTVEVQSDLADEAEDLQQEEQKEEDLTKEADDTVPLAKMFEDIMSNENARMVSVIGAVALTLVMAGVFGTVWSRKRAKAEAKSKRVSIRRK
jgi:hypothetical protein